MKVYDLWFRVQGLGRRVQSVGCRVQGCRVQGAGVQGCRVQGEGCRVQGAGCRVQGAGRRAQSAGCQALDLGGWGWGSNSLSSSRACSVLPMFSNFELMKACFKDNCLAKLWSGSEEGAYLRLIHCSITQL